MLTGRPSLLGVRLDLSTMDRPAAHEKQKNSRELAAVLATRNYSLEGESDFRVAGEASYIEAHVQPRGTARPRHQRGWKPLVTNSYL